MNKTEYKKLQITEVIKMLENDFKAEFTGDDEGGRLGLELNGFYGELSRRDFDVCFWDSTSLSGNGWSGFVFKRQKDAVELETVVNESIQSLLKYMRYLEPAN
jgi:hypothetical protein